MYLKINRLIFVFIFFSAQTFSDKKNLIYTEINSNTYSDIAPINQFFDGLKGPPLQEGDHAITTTTAALGQKIHVNDRFGGISYEFFTRYDYFIEFTPDTAEIFWADKNDQPLDQNKVYDVDLFANHISAHGLKLGYHGQALKNLSYQVHFSYLHAYDMLYGGLWGHLDGLGNDAEGELYLDYFYSEDKFFDREPSKYNAKGYAIDLGAHWLIHEKFDIELYAKDIYSRIDWRQHRTHGSASSDRVRFDENGLLQARPALSWWEIEGDLSQEFPIQLDLRERFHFTSRDTIELRHYAYEEHIFNRIAYRHRFFSKIYTALSYSLNTGAKGIDIDMPYMRLRIESDNNDFEQAEHISFTLGFYLPY